MSDEVSTGELARRLDAFNGRFDEVTRLLQGLVSRAEYTADQRHTERRFTELESDIVEKRRKHDEDFRELREELKTLRTETGTELKALRTKVDEDGKASGVNFRQAVYNGLVPGIFLLLTLLVAIWSATKGGK